VTHRPPAGRDRDSARPLAPLVSIGVPVYNGQRFVARTLASILAQTHRDLEVLICDNASTDETEKICRAYAERDQRIRYWRSGRNVGAAANYNRTFAQSSGRYFKWAAADDEFAPEFIERAVQRLEEDPGAVLAYSRIGLIDEAGALLSEWEMPQSLDVSSVVERLRRLELCGLHFEPNCALTLIFGLIRSDVLRRTPLIGSFAGSDTCVLVDLLLAGRFVAVPHPFLLLRRHPGSFTVQLSRTIRAGGMEGASQAEWFDPANAGRIVLPHWRFLLEHARSVLRCEAPPPEKARMLEFLCRTANWRRTRLKRELVGALRQVWSRVPARKVRA
jgi:glycosyltransferase involved in cell wall biosynthesis